MKKAQPIRSKHQIRELTDYFLKRGEKRNYVLIVLGLYTALRISDLLQLRWDDVYDFTNECIYDSITITEKKTGKVKTIALNENVKNALLLYLCEARSGKFILSNKNTGNAISRVQAHRIICKAADELKFQNRVSCHSLRKTFGHQAWKSGVSPAILMEIYNHGSMSTTKHYLGVSQDDKDSVYLGLDLTT